MNSEEQKNKLIIYFDDKNHNHLYKDCKDGLWGVVDSFQKLIVEHQYSDILETSIHADVAGWGAKPWKYFWILTFGGEVRIFNCQALKMLPVLFEGVTAINKEFIFKDVEDNFWVLEYSTESVAPCRYDKILHGLAHKGAIQPGYELMLKNYADRYFENFVSRYLQTPDEKAIIKKHCYHSIESPELILGSIEDLVRGSRHLLAIVVINYIENLLLDKFPRPGKKEKAYFGACYFLKGKTLYYLDREKEAVTEFEKSFPFLETLKDWQKFWLYYFYIDCLYLTESSTTREIEILKTHFESLSYEDKEGFKADFQELVEKCAKA